MPNLHRGEVAFPLAGQTHVLRPSFQILCQIEGRLGRKIDQLAIQLARHGLLTHELVTILALATRHDGSQPLSEDVMLSLPMDQWNEAKPHYAVAQFLAAALPLLPWDVLQETAWAVLKLSPQDFWALTTPEFKALLRAKRREQRGAAVLPYPSRDDVALLVQQFPDAA